MIYYTEAELREIQSTEPERAFYLRHEDELREMGIDLTIDNWDSILRTSIAPMPGENRYRFFLRSLQDEGGITFINRLGDLQRVYVKNDEPNKIFTELVAKKTVREPQFDEPVPERPEKPGIGYRFLRAITFGLYKPEACRRYEQEMQSYSEALERYNRAKAAFETSVLAEYNERVAKFNEYNKSLEARGSSEEKREAYQGSFLKHYREMEKVRGQATSQISNCEKLKQYGQQSMERLDFIFGPKVDDDEQRTRLRQNCVDAGIFHSDDFGKPQPGDKHMRIVEISYPDDCEFSPREIALLGYAATCSRDTVVKAYLRPDPDKPPVEQNISENKQIEVDCKWYNYIDAIITRHPRAAAGSAPLINYAKRNVARAFIQYDDGDPAPLGKIIFNGIRRSTMQMALQSEIHDDATFADYGRFCSYLIDIMNAHPKLKKAVIDAGLTPEHMRDAEIAINMGRTWDNGLRAVEMLATNNNLTAEQKVSAAADIAGMRLVQQMLIKATKDFKEGPEYTALEQKCVNECERTLLEEKASVGTPEHAEKQRALAEANGKLYSIGVAYILEAEGLDVSPNEEMRGLFYGDKRPEEVHNLFTNIADIKKLSELTNNNILYEMSAKNAVKYVEKVFPKKEAKPVVQEAPAVQKQNAAALAK